MFLYDRHLGIFDLIKSEDEKELASRYDTVSTFWWLNCSNNLIPQSQQSAVDGNDANKMVEVLLHNTNYSSAYGNLLSILHHCLLLPGN